MTHQEINDGNKLLGMFLNNRSLLKDKTVEGGYAWNGRYVAPSNVTNIYPELINKIYSPSELLFHSDWNWIMGVVDKIESLDCDVFISSGHIEIWSNKEVQVVVYIPEDIATNTITKVWESCVEFVKWQNNEV